MQFDGEKTYLTTHLEISCLSFVMTKSMQWANGKGFLYPDSGTASDIQLAKIQVLYLKIHT